MGKENIIGKEKDYFYNLLKDESLKEAEWGLEFSSVIILPTEIPHDSGFSIMHFVLLDEDNKPIAKATRGADVIRVWREPDRWHMDCLPCGLLRFFHVGRNSKVFYNGMEFEFFSVEEDIFGETRT